MKVEIDITRCTDWEPHVIEVEVDPCEDCNGTGYILEDWAEEGESPNLHEYKCRSCGGKGY